MSLTRIGNVFFCFLVLFGDVWQFVCDFIKKTETKVLSTLVFTYSEVYIFVKDKNHKNVYDMNCLDRTVLKNKSIKTTEIISIMIIHLRVKFKER